MRIFERRKFQWIYLLLTDEPHGVNSIASEVKNENYRKQCKSIEVGSENTEQRRCSMTVTWATLKSHLPLKDTIARANQKLPIEKVIELYGRTFDPKCVSDWQTVDGGCLMDGCDGRLRLNRSQNRMMCLDGSCQRVGGGDSTNWIAKWHSITQGAAAAHILEFGEEAFDVEPVAPKTQDLVAVSEDTQPKRPIPVHPSKRVSTAQASRNADEPKATSNVVAAAKEVDLDDDEEVTVPNYPFAETYDACEPMAMAVHGKGGARY